MNLTSAMTQFFGQAVASMHTAIPAKVTKADAGSGLVSVVPTIRIPMENGVEIEVPELQDVPVVFPQAAAFDLHFPVVAGDLVLLVFLEVSSTNWREGDGMNPVSPTDTGRFQLGSAVAIPGLYPRRKKGKCTLEVDEQGRITFTAEQINFDGQVVFRKPVIATQDIYAGTPGTPGISLKNHIHPTAVGPSSIPTNPTPVPVPPEK